MLIGLHQPYAANINTLDCQAIPFPTSGRFRFFFSGVFKVLVRCMTYGGDNGGWNSGTFCYVLEVIHSLNRPVQIEIAQTRSNTSVFTNAFHDSCGCETLLCRFLILNACCRRLLLHILDSHKSLKWFPKALGRLKSPNPNKLNPIVLMCALVQPQQCSSRTCFGNKCKVTHPDQWVAVWPRSVI